MKSSSKPTEKRFCRDSDNTTQTYIKRKETKKSGR
jgi:hypothetical protein